MTLLQLHWQYKDGTTEMRAQKDIISHKKLRAFVREIQKTHPLPNGAIWMVCNQKSKDFVLTKDVK